MLTTTWTPRYVLPRIVQTQTSTELRFAQLATKEGIAGLAPLVTEFGKWLEQTRSTSVDAGFEGAGNAEQLANEKAKLEEDLGHWERELKALEHGLALLTESAAHWSGPGPQKDARGIPCEAWFAMNEAMRAVGEGKYDSWRLFQLCVHCLDDSDVCDQNS